MQGKRVEWNAQILNPGEYSKCDVVWFCCSPNGFMGNLIKHNVVEHEDGTITVTPSILITINNSKGVKEELWHGYLEKGTWREC